MTDKASPDPQELARFLQDWTTLWREEMLAHATDPTTLETWRAALAFWANAALTPPSAMVRPRERPGRTGAEGPGTAGEGTGTAAPAGTKAAAAAPDPRDAAIERLVHRIEVLESRLAGLEGSAGPGKPLERGKPGKRAREHDTGKPGGPKGSVAKRSGQGGGDPGRG